MGYAFDLSDVRFLRSAEGSDVLARCADLPLTTASRLADVAAVRAVAGDHAPAVLETLLLRRRAVAKLTEAQHWLFTDDALQQATPTLVARHRAQRLAGRDVHDVTCSVGAELAELTGVAGRVLGSDLDPVRLAMAAHNVAGVALARADALAPVSRDTVVLADPGRRDTRGRRHDPAALQPPLPALLEVYRGRDLAVKCAPGLDVDLLDWAGEVELVSLDGGVREACLYSAGLSSPGHQGPVHRRATVLSSRDAAWTITDAEPDDTDVRPVGEWIVEPDGAVVRAGLVRHYGARHGLGQLDSHIAYLTGDVPPPGVRAFRVLEELAYSEKALRQALRRRGASSVEILVRGLDVDPAVLRPRLKLAGRSGGPALSVVLARIGDAHRAYVCTAHRTS
ncbi:class I SAM-dependent methyltransferase [Rhodococcus sp. X156]|uniref:THUMP-like domain-containing protein n=1 Tax=Rhodococcus sp. X156 TaxID=2499145 RepID=UPI000FDB7627|nr:class I SAM-dependent methyltransferase [Rhodococcus sp. X156]